VLLDQYVRSRRGRRLGQFEALHILHGLAAGLDEVHARREYHGDLHPGNVLVQRCGVHIDLKLVDLHDLGRPTKLNIADDVVDLIRLFDEMLGGPKHYASLPPELKYIIAARRAPTIRRRFPTATALRDHLDTFEWTTP
jgi:serine/threonine protein kinase